MSDPSCFLFRRDPVCLVPIGTFLVGAETLSKLVSVKLDTGLWGQNSRFYSVGPKKMWPRNCLKLHQIAVFLLLTERALFHPLVLLRQAGGSQWLAAGPFPVECHLFWVTAVWQSALWDTLQQPVSPWACSVQHRRVFSSHRKFRETHYPDFGSLVIGENLEVSHLRI